MRLRFREESSSPSSLVNLAFRWASLSSSQTSTERFFRSSNQICQVTLSRPKSSPINSARACLLACLIDSLGSTKSLRRVSAAFFFPVFPNAMIACCLMLSARLVFSAICFSLNVALPSTLAPKASAAAKRTTGSSIESASINSSEKRPSLRSLIAPAKAVKTSTLRGSRRYCLTVSVARGFVVAVSNKQLGPATAVVFYQQEVLSGVLYRRQVVEPVLSIKAVIKSSLKSSINPLKRKCPRGGTITSWEYRVNLDSTHVGIAYF